MIKLLLYGDLGKKFGETKQFSVRSLHELFCALSSNNTNFRRYLNLQEQRGIFYQIFVNDKQLSCTQQMGNNLSVDSVVKVIPVPLGNFGSGIGSSNKTNSALALGIGTLFVVAGAFMLATPLAPVGVALIFGGVSLIAMGVIGLLSPQPKFQAEEARKGSYLFDGMIEAARQGSPVPLVYGRMLINGLTINSTIRTSDSNGA